MRLSELMKDWPCTLLQGSIRRMITGITESSVHVEKGNLFVARKGKNSDGADYIADAVERGATTIVIDRGQSIVRSVPEGVTVLSVPDCSLFLSYASARFWGNPGEEITIIAVTGTNGKTTVSHFIGQLLEAQGGRPAVIGTTGVYWDGELKQQLPDSLTTMPAEALHPLLRKCVDQGLTHVILEASSIGLSSNRLAHCPISVGALLNVGVDHYAEHGGRLPYIEAKTQLVHLAKKLVVNLEDEICCQMSKAAAGALLYFSSDSIGETLVTAEELSLQVPGRHNEMNVRAALGVMLALGYDLEETVPYAAALRLPEGRLEKYSERGVEVFIDYAHTPDALSAVLETLKGYTKGRLITVFGCGGDRDREKRPQMGAVAAQFSSYVILTSDNPRTEDPSRIIIDILAGTAGFPTPVDVVLNRQFAIRYAIQNAQYGDVVLIAGKGHEKTQQIGRETMPFCDMEQAKQAFRLNGKAGKDS